ncbi:MAG TPA: hypothetical protein PKA33_18300 [Amaricoccus sp.]|uniref:hypothetical protein n=1 Tax=Amaricoccus sp. TaxID=1872485 RepID=UPI002B8C6A14|nr:hypothetical protein [Amaricoccus sp.]HMQ95050.1 hypothetical protein [Amaricoccus sp.]HMR54291.1 hypothetical protein [Amaricoccus sp.]HMR61881.1 hypothetical protein [Amaricoccus sp.]HMU01298.1 hypothetical protein [Amaricoccus sp.]
MPRIAATLACCAAVALAGAAASSEEAAPLGDRRPMLGFGAVVDRPPDFRLDPDATDSGSGGEPRAARGGNVGFVFFGDAYLGVAAGGDRAGAVSGIGGGATVTIRP